jgi:hypothetical protein
MKNIKTLVIVAGLLVASSLAQANPITIDFKALANIKEYGVTPLRFDSVGNVTTSISDTVLAITATNGSDSYAYLDAGDAGLGVCGKITASLQCNPSSDDNVSFHNGTPETLHFAFNIDVIIEKIWFNNNHDGDRSLLNDFVAINGTGMQLTNGGHKQDSVLDLGLDLSANDFFDVGFYENQPCVSTNLNNCEFYVSKIEYSIAAPGSGSANVPEPTALALLGLGLFGAGAVRRRQK